jgi:hypothetical protein
MCKRCWTIICILAYLHAPAQDSVRDRPPIQEHMPDVDSVYVSKDPDGAVIAIYFDSIRETHQPVERRLPDSVVRAIKANDAYWYADQAPQKEEQTQNNNNPAPGTGLFNFLFWFLMIGTFIALIVWFLSSSNIRLFRRHQKNIDGTLEEPVTENIFELDFEKELAKAIAAGDYRMAVRLMYLRTLRQLSDRQLINYTHEKTNTDYLFQLSGTTYYHSFFRLTRNFEYTWYGGFPLTAATFERMRSDFSGFKQQIS